MKLSERVRWWFSFLGVMLWFGFPVVFAFGGAARHLYRCRDRTFTGEFDDCFNDYIPVLEVIFVPLVFLVFAYPFARFAFSLFAPDQRERTHRWRLASSEGASTYWPMLQMWAGLGIALSLWSLSRYPLHGEFLPYYAYWLSFGLWFTAAIFAGRPVSASES